MAGAGGAKPLAGMVLVLNFCMYLIVCGTAGWDVNGAIKNDIITGEGIPLPNMFWAVYFPMGNAETSFMVIFALIAGVVGAGSCLSRIHHIMSWKHESLAAASGAMTAWPLTLLAMGGWGQSSLGYLFGSDAPTTTNPIEKPPPVAVVAQPEGQASRNTNISHMANGKNTGNFNWHCAR